MRNRICSGPVGGLNLHEEGRLAGWAEGRGRGLGPARRQETGLRTAGETSRKDPWGQRSRLGPGLKGLTGYCPHESLERSRAGGLRSAPGLRKVSSRQHRASGRGGRLHCWEETGVLVRAASRSVPVTGGWYGSTAPCFSETLGWQ